MKRSKFSEEQIVYVIQRTVHSGPCPRGGLNFKGSRIRIRIRDLAHARPRFGIEQ
jgi:hypothetical protein